MKYLKIAYCIYIAVMLTIMAASMAYVAEWIYKLMSWGR